MVNGGGFKNPTRTKDVDFEGRVSAKPTDWLTFGAGFYSGHLGQVTEANATFASNTATRWDVAAGVGVAGFRGGAEYFHAKNYRAASASTGVLAGPVGVVITVTASGAVYKSEKVDNGSISVGGADANGSYTIGGTGVAGTGTTTGGKFEEIGVFAQYSF